MKSITIFVFLILTASLVLGGTTNTVFAQDNPPILLKIAKTAQDQIQRQISIDSSEEIKNLFEEGQKGVIALENSLSNNDMTSAKEHFLSTMKIFTKISHQLASSQTTQYETKTIPNTPNPSNDLHRMQGYLNSLKVIAKNHNATVDFSLIDNLFLDAKTQINNNRYAEATQTIQEIKKTITELNGELRQQASQQESNRAQAFAQKYLKQLDRLIENAQKTGISEDIIEKLKASSESLSLATSPSEVVNGVRNILLLQQQFELSEDKLLDLRIIELEKSILEISNSDQLTQDTIQGINKNLQTIKDLLTKKEFERATELLGALETILEKIQI
ncbi:MAG TPA: hypothetical protein VMW55_00175 [Nitrosopumilaceae archaeon]|nr:hypothetical protein [Nitrosopumilaceae archaeon]